MSVDMLSHSAKQRSDTRPSLWSALSRLVLAVVHCFRIHGADTEQNVSPCVTSKVSHSGSGLRHGISDMPIGGNIASANDHYIYRPRIGAPIKWSKPDRNNVSENKAEPPKGKSPKAEPPKGKSPKAEPPKNSKHDEDVLEALTSGVGLKKVLKIMKKLGLSFSRKHNAMYTLVDFFLLLMTAYDGKSRIHSVDGQYMNRKAKDSELPSRTWMYNLIKSVRPDYMLKRSMAMIRSTIAQARQHGLLRGVLVIAIDMHDIPVYAKKIKDEYIRKAKSKNGTSTFIRVISVHCVINGERFTLGATIMRKDDKTAAVVRKLLSACRTQGIKISYVLMDRGFHSVDVLNTLEEMGLKVLMPAVKTGKSDGNGIKNAIMEHHSGKRAAVSTYTLSNSDNDSTASYTLIIIKRDEKKAKCKKTGKKTKSDDPNDHIIKQYLVFATTLPKSMYASNPANLLKIYAQRWGIENSYKSLKQLRLRTTSTNYSVRFLLYLMPFVLCNMWVLISNLFTRQMNYNKYTQCMLGIFIGKFLDAVIAFRDGPRGRPPG